MVTVLARIQPKINRTKPGLHGNSSFLPSGFGGCFDYIKQVDVVLNAMKRFALFSQCIHHLGESIGPQPGWINRLNLFPAGGSVSPYFEAAWVPIIPEKIRGSFRPIKFQTRTPVALNAVT